MKYAAEAQSAARNNGKVFAMKKLSRILAITLSLVIAAAMMVPVSAEGLTAVYGAPAAIDGELDDGWAGAADIALNMPLWTPGEGFSATAKIMYDGTYLYFFVDVTDPTVGTLEQETVGAADYWQRDTVQIYLDLGNEKTEGARDENDIRFDVNVRGAFFAHMIRAGQFIKRAVKITDKGYNVECAVDLGIYPGFKNKEGTEFGLDIWVGDAGADFAGRVGAVTISGNTEVYRESNNLVPVKLGAKPDGAKGYSGLIKGTSLNKLGAKYSPIANAAGGHMDNIACIVDGYRGDYSAAVDEWSCTYTDDLGQWVGLELGGEFDVKQVIFWEGGHWGNGGWFATAPKIQCFVDGAWVDVQSKITPAYPGNSFEEQGFTFEPYIFTLNSAVTCSKIRVISDSRAVTNGDGVIESGHYSVSEIEVYGYKAGSAATADPTVALVVVAVVSVLGAGITAVSKKRG